MAKEGRLEFAYVSVDDLVPFEGNPRKIKPKGLEKLQISVESFGFVSPIIAQKGSNMIISGHQRWEAAKAAGLLEVAVVFVDFDDDTAMAYNIADNKLKEESEWDFDALADLFEHLDTGAFDLTITGFDENELERLMTWTPPIITESEDVLKVDEEEPNARLGDVYQLGEHFLICGDATDPMVWNELIAYGGKPSLIFTSPPYPGADMWETEGEKLVDVGNKVMQIAYDTLAQGSVLVWNTADIPRGNDGYIPNVARDIFTANDLGFRYRGEVIWDKDIKSLPIFGAYRRPTIPNNTHESILVFFKGAWKPRDKKGALHSEAMEWNRYTIWQIHTETEAKKIGHIAPFPLELAVRVLTLWSLPDDFVLDPFMGSGTTIMAAEQLGRKALGIEIEPRYIDVAINRWEAYTGKKAVQVQGGDGS